MVEGLVVCLKDCCLHSGQLRRMRVALPSIQNLVLGLCQDNGTVKPSANVDGKPPTWEVLLHPTDPKLKFLKCFNLKKLIDFSWRSSFEVDLLS